jgi:DNA-binding NarL/FixJ family response regulator
VDDHQILIDSLKSLLDTNEYYDLSYTALNGQAAIRIALEESIDVVLLDIGLPDISGLEVCKQIKAQAPNIKVIALTMYDEAYYIKKMMKYQVDGYLLKNTNQEELEEAIDTVLGGGRYFNEMIKNQLFFPSSTMQRKPNFIQTLTRREKEILHLIVGELTAKEMSKKLFISEETVISHRKALLRKLNAKNTAGIVKKAYEFNLLDD